MTLDEKFELYLDLPFIEFLHSLQEDNVISLEEYNNYENALWSLEDEEYINDKNDFKLEILDELGALFSFYYTFYIALFSFYYTFTMYEDLFIDYQKRMGNL